MADRLRVARLDASAYSPLANTGPTAEDCKSLQSLIGRHLSPVTASVFAAPAPMPDSKTIEWYSDLSGQPRTLASLPDAEKARVSGLLSDRLNALGELAERLTHANPQAAEQLRSALSYPGEETVYDVGGQPVLTFWGYAPLQPVLPEPVPIEPGPDPSSAIAPTTRGHTSRGWLPLGALLVLALALAVGAWWYYCDFRWPPWLDYADLAQAARDKHQTLKRQEEALETRLQARLVRCAISDALTAARSEEIALQYTAQTLEQHLTSRIETCQLQKAEEERRRRDAMKPGAPLTIPEEACEIGSTTFFDGSWQSISKHTEYRTGAPLVVHLDIRGGRGRVTRYVQSGSSYYTCTGPVTVTMRTGSNCELIIADTRRAICHSGQISYWERTLRTCSVGSDRAVTCRGEQETLPSFKMTIKRR